MRDNKSLGELMVSSRIGELTGATYQRGIALVKYFLETALKHKKAATVTLVSVIASTVFHFLSQYAVSHYTAVPAAVIPISGFSVNNATPVSSLTTPGPNQYLFDHPYYSCSTNYYVNGSTGSNSYDGTSPTFTGGATGPWATLQKASNTNTGAGSCINVANGTYDGVQVINGGNLASQTGYVVYRCVTLDGCTITGNSGLDGTASITIGYCISGAGWTCPADYQHPQYVMFDGFVLDGPDSSSGNEFGFMCVGQFGASGPTAQGPHHCWLLNSIIQHFGHGGTVAYSNDYIYVIHSTIYDTSTRVCGGTQGSGLAYVSLYTPAGYSATIDDKSGAAPYFGFPTWTLADSTWFHTVTAFNILYNNTTKCGVESDHNGIIFDTNTTGSGIQDNGNGNYSFPELAYGNVVYNNGGNGIHVFVANEVYVANNTTFNNGLDNYAVGNGITAIGGVTSHHNYSFNNVDANCTTATGGSTLAANPYYIATISGTDVVTNNVTLQVKSDPGVCNYSSGNDYWLDGTATDPSASNKPATNPLWSNVTFASPGTDTTQPAGHNFALTGSSPAIGYGTTAYGWLPSTAVDAGACPSSLTTCP